MRDAGVDFGDFFFVQAVDHSVNRIDKGLDGVFLPGRQHPADQCAAPFPVKGIEGQIHDLTRATLASPAGADGIDHTFAHGKGKILRQRALQTGG